jgi:hypothetical protein
MSPSRIFAFSLCIVLFSSIRLESQEIPTTLTCLSNAKATRDYAFVEKRWGGEEGGAMFGLSRMFKIQTRDSTVANAFYSLRDKVFSGLDTDRPIVRSITRYTDGVDKGEEFPGAVLMRTEDAVFLMWTNRVNKIWLATVDLTHRRAILTQVFQGATSVGGEIETLDCR